MRLRLAVIARGGFLGLALAFCSTGLVVAAHATPGPSIRVHLLEAKNGRPIGNVSLVVLTLPNWEPPPTVILSLQPTTDRARGAARCHSRLRRPRRPPGGG